MASHAATNLGRRLRLVIAGAVVVTALTTATAGAALPPANGGAATADAPQPRRPATALAGFVYHQGRFGRGVYTPLREVPGAAITAHLGINDHGQITGNYIDAADIPNPDGTFDTGHGFVQDGRGHTTSFDAPGALITLPNGINDHCQITGAYVAGDGTASVHGFTRDRARRHHQLRGPLRAAAQRLRHQQPRPDRRLLRRARLGRGRRLPT